MIIFLSHLISKKFEYYFIWNNKNPLCIFFYEFKIILLVFSFALFLFLTSSLIE